MESFLGYKSKGFPHRVSEIIDLPTIEEMLLTPFMDHVPIDIAYKYSHDWFKNVLDKTPFTYTKKYIYVLWNIRLLEPSVSPVTNINRLDLEWHVDGNNSFEEDDVIYHLMINNTSSMTEFNTTIFETEDTYNCIGEFIKDLNDENKYANILVPKEIEPFRIYTFDNNDIHRARRTSRPELRFIYRAFETNNPLPDHSSGFLGKSYVYNGNADGLVNGVQTFEDGYVKKIDFIRKHY